MDECADATDGEAAAPYWPIADYDERWEVHTAETDWSSKRVTITLGWKNGARSACPRCGREQLASEFTSIHTWVDTRAKVPRLFIVARVPKFLCPHHGAFAAPPVSARHAQLSSSADCLSAVALISCGTVALRRMLQCAAVQTLYDHAIKPYRRITSRVHAPLLRNKMRRITTSASLVTLPYDPDPPYKAYHCIAAHPLSILGSATDLRPLLASDYINLSCPKAETISGYLGAMIVPFRPIGHFALTGHCELNRNAENVSFDARHCDRLIQLLIDMLDDHWYVLAHVNKFYLPQTAGYGKYDMLHDCLLVGYDATSTVFLVLMYTENGTYSVVRVPFTSMALALTLRGAKLLLDHHPCHAPAVLGVRPTSELRFEFDLGSARRNLCNYLQSAPPGERGFARDQAHYVGDWFMLSPYPREPSRYGLEAFTLAIERIKGYLETGTPIDMSGPRVIWEHKRIMHSNIAFWGAQSSAASVRDMNSLYVRAVKWAYSVHVNAFAYNLDRQRYRRGLGKLLESAQEVVSIEREALHQMLELLKRAEVQNLEWSESPRHSG